MKRKVKFQTGGDVVESPARRRVRLADEARTRSLEYYDDLARRNRQAAEERATSRRAFEQGRPVVPAGGGAGGPPALPPSSGAPMAPGGGRPPMPVPEPGGAMVPRSRTDFSGMMQRGLSGMRGGAPSMRPGVAGAALALLPLAEEGREALMRGIRGSAAGEGDEYGLNEQPPAMDRLENTDQMRPLPAAPAAPARPRARPQARPQGRGGLTADRLNALMLGEEPRNADEVMALFNIQRRRRQLEGGPAMKKGGVVKKKAGGMIAAKAKAPPKKMMKGGVVAKPKVKAAMKKGGMVKKGKK